MRNSTSIDTATRTLNVEVDVPNPQTQTSCQVSTPSCICHWPRRSGSLTVPSNVLLTRAEGLRVAVVRDNRIHLAVHVQIGHDYGATVEVTCRPRRTDDQVVLNPSDSIAEGAEVRIEGGK